jgi:hypothetical protein
MNDPFLCGHESLLNDNSEKSLECRYL